MRKRIMRLMGAALLLSATGCGDDGEGDSAPTFGPEITFIGIARADDIPLEPVGTDGQGRPIFARSLGQGMSLVIEARRGQSGAAVGLEAMVDVGTPDLQILVSRPLGNGSTVVCDIDPDDPSKQGGVPGTASLTFNDSVATRDALNDMGCRVNDGTGQHRGRTNASEACTQSDDPGGFGFGFVDPRSRAQFCLPIARPWAFPDGDTIVAARVRDTDGNFGDVVEIVIRVGS